jgi:dimethylaniline monooxygenase (N-oxide forming)
MANETKLHLKVTGGPPFWWEIYKIMSRLIRLGVGDQRRFGLKRPEHPMWREHATLSQELLPYLGHGWISMKPDVSRLNGKEITFEDGSREIFDAIIYATGYKTTFPFLDKSTFNSDTDTTNLYRRMVSLKHPGLIFAGLVQPVGPTIPLVEIQGRWLASVLSGDIALPEPEVQAREVAQHQKYQRETYLDAARYVLEVDFRTYPAQMHADVRRTRASV